MACPTSAAGTRTDVRAVAAGLMSAVVLIGAGTAVVWLALLAERALSR
jgi:hypothetical protein